MLCRSLRSNSFSCSDFLNVDLAEQIRDVADVSEVIRILITSCSCWVIFTGLWYRMCNSAKKNE